MKLKEELVKKMQENEKSIMRLKEMNAQIETLLDYIIREEEGGELSQKQTSFARVADGIFSIDTKLRRERQAMTVSDLIVEFLKDRRGPIKSQDIYRELKRIKPDLNRDTFDSAMYQLKRERKNISQVRRGYYRYERN